MKADTDFKIYRHTRDRLKKLAAHAKVSMTEWLNRHVEREFNKLMKKLQGDKK